MVVTSLDESVIQDIGHAFGYYDYGSEKGLVSLYSSRQAAAEFICGYVRMALKAGMLHATGPRGEGYIAFKHPGERVSLGAGLLLARGLLGSMNAKELVRFFRLAAKGGPGLDGRMKKEKKPFIFVGMVCVREPYQGQGYMRKLLEIAFAEGNRLQVPVILDMDAKSKCDKYMHLGMELAGTRNFGENGTLYDLIKYPDANSPTAASVYEK